MKLRCKFVINTVAGENIAVPVGKNCDFRGYIKLNSTGKDIFAALEKDTDREKIIALLQKKYPEAKNGELAESVDGIIAKLTQAQLLI